MLIYFELSFDIDSNRYTCISHCYSYIAASLVAFGGAIYISPFTCGTKFETSIMKEPRDLPTSA